jgi:hypothetical protein
MTGTKFRVWIGDERIARRYRTSRMVEQACDEICRRPARYLLKLLQVGNMPPPPGTPDERWRPLGQQFERRKVRGADNREVPPV